MKLRDNDNNMNYKVNMIIICSYYYSFICLNTISGFVDSDIHCVLD